MPTTLGDALRDMNRRPGGYILVDAKGEQYNSLDMARDLAPAVLQVAVVWGVDNPVTEEGYVYNVSPSGMDFDHPWFLFHAVQQFGGRTLSPDEGVALAQLAMTLVEHRARVDEYNDMLRHARALSASLDALEDVVILQHDPSPKPRTWNRWIDRVKQLEEEIRGAMTEAESDATRLYALIAAVRDRRKTVPQVIAEEEVHANDQNG